MIFFILHNWEKSIQRYHRKLRDLESKSISQRRMPRESEKSALVMIDEKSTDGTSSSQKDQDEQGKFFVNVVMNTHFFLNRFFFPTDFFYNFVHMW